MLCSPLPRGFDSLLIPTLVPLRRLVELIQRTSESGHWSLRRHVQRQSTSHGQHCHRYDENRFHLNLLYFTTAELMRELENSCPSFFSIEIGNERIRLPVA